MRARDLNLREAKESEVDGLITRAKHYLPNSFTIIAALSFGFKRELYNRKYTKLYIPTEENFPFFVVITGVLRKENRQNLTLFWDPREVASNDAKTLLISLPNWSWEAPMYVASSWIDTLDELERILLGNNGLANNKLTLLRNDGYVYKLPEDTPECLNTRDIGHDVVLAPLNETHAQLVHSNWRYNFAEDQEGLANYLKQLPSMAAFVRLANQDDSANTTNGQTFSYKPVSWAIAKTTGEIGCTFTYPEYRSRGLASAVTCALVKRLLENNIPPFVNICGANEASVKSHEKIGLERYSPVGYHLYGPVGIKREDYGL